LKERRKKDQAIHTAGALLFLALSSLIVSYILAAVGIYERRPPPPPPVAIFAAGILKSAPAMMALRSPSARQMGGVPAGRGVRWLASEALCGRRGGEAGVRLWAPGKFGSQTKVIHIRVADWTNSKICLPFGSQLERALHADVTCFHDVGTVPPKRNRGAIFWGRRT
jgi:hypothetical protein